MGLLGVLGEYLWRTFDEARKRPPFIIAETIDGEGNNTIPRKGIREPTYIIDQSEDRGSVSEQEDQRADHITFPPA